MNRRSAPPAVPGLLIAVSCWAAPLPAAAQVGDAEPQASARSYTGPIIDMHLHAYTPADYWGAASGDALESARAWRDHAPDRVLRGVTTPPDSSA